MKVFNLKKQKDLRSKLRQDLPMAEKILWGYLRGGSLGAKFRRQHGIGNYIVDFYSPAAKLIIEIDGDSHFEEGVDTYDAQRAHFFNGQGLREIRFTNCEVYNDLERVLDEIKKQLK